MHQLKLLKYVYLFLASFLLIHKLDLEVAKLRVAFTYWLKIHTGFNMTDTWSFMEAMTLMGLMFIRNSVENRNRNLFRAVEKNVAP
jgi:hypothetical protein